MTNAADKLKATDEWGDWLRRLSPKAVSGMLAEHCQTQPSPEPVWYIFLHKDGEWMEQITCSSFKDVQAKLIQIMEDKDEKRVHVCYGVLAKISKIDEEDKTPFPYLAHPNGTLLPLFNPVRKLEFEQEGKFGEIELNVGVLRRPKTEDVSTNTDTAAAYADDDFEDEADEDD